MSLKSLSIGAQQCHIQTVEQLRGVGFEIGQPVQIGFYENQPLFRALVAGKELRGVHKPKPHKPHPCPPQPGIEDPDELEAGKCVKGVGPCGGGKIEFLEDGRIIAAYINIIYNESGNEVGSPAPLVRMYYDAGEKEFWVLPVR